jgi:hypothetical protein
MRFWAKNNKNKYNSKEPIVKMVRDLKIELPIASLGA